MRSAEADIVMIALISAAVSVFFVWTEKGDKRTEAEVLEYSGEDNHKSERHVERQLGILRVVAWDSAEASTC